MITLISAKGSRQMLLTLERFPTRLFTISELAKVSGVPFSSAWNVVRSWERAGIVDTGRVGRAVTVKLAGTDVAAEALRLVKGAVSPQKLAVQWLRGEIGNDGKVASAYLFGSVAAGKESLESDIDVAVLAKPGFEPAALSERAEERFRAKLVSVVFSNKVEIEEFLKGKDAVRLK